ncbi:MAG: NUDIX hydrolase [Candidatus Elarobacter sp.]
MSEIRDAATVMTVRDTAEGLQVFMVRRNARAVFLPDNYVFPGGRVDDADREAAAHARLRGSAGDVDPAYAITAARETFEEVGLLFADREVDIAALDALRRAMLAGDATFEDVLARLNVALDASLLVYFSRWVTPKAELARRFDTRFFVARAPKDQVAEADAAEVTDGRWFRPLDALEARRRGEINLIFPTIKHLERIAPYRTVDELLAFARTKSIVAVTPDVQPGPSFVLLAEIEDAW